MIDDDDLISCYNLCPGYLKSLGADLVLDMTVAEDLSLLEAQQEFIQRYQDQQNDPAAKNLPMLASSCPGDNTYLPFLSAVNLKIGER